MKETKQKVHYLADFLANPVHPIQVKLAGVGGNGTHMLKGLAAIHAALLSLGHMGISVIAYDDDTVSKSNVGRQLFYPSDLGKNKAEIFINRINRSYGFSWIAIPHRLKALNMTDGKCNIFISCVDKGKTRMQFWEWMKNYIIKSMGANLMSDVQQSEVIKILTDILDELIDIARFRGIPPSLSKELIDLACQAYFLKA